jgi:hypothetical protein
MMFLTTSFELLQAYRLIFKLGSHCTGSVQQTEIWRTGVVEYWRL